MKTDPDHGPMDNQEAVSNRRIDALEAELFLERSLRVAAQEAIAPQAERIAELQRRLENEELGAGERLHQANRELTALRNAVEVQKHDERALRELVKAQSEAIRRLEEEEDSPETFAFVDKVKAMTPDNFPTETKGGDCTGDRQQKAPTDVSGIPSDPASRSTEPHAEVMKYANELRAACNRLSPEEREAALKEGMQIIYGAPAVQETKGGAA